MEGRREEREKGSERMGVKGRERERGMKGEM